jgi:hypothetical protein
MPLVPYSKSSPRVRSCSATYKSYSLNDGQQFGYQNVTGSYGCSNEFSGFKQSDWRLKISRREQATTTASGTKIVLKSTPAIFYADYEYVDFLGRLQRDRYEASGDLIEIQLLNYLGFVGLGGAVPRQEIENDATIGFLRKAKSAQRHIMTGVFFGELRETLRLIKSPAAALRGLLNEYVTACRRKSRRLSPKEQAQMVANQWLEYSFGMLPLASDIEGGFQALNELYKDLPYEHVRKVVERKFWSSHDVISTSIHSNTIPVKLQRTIDRYGGMKIVGVVRLRQQESEFSSFDEKFGLTVSDFVPTVYELIPWSFLVDYFTNIGNVLEACSFCQSDLIWYSKSEFNQDVEYYEMYPGSSGNAQLKRVNGSPCIYIRNSSSFSRTGSSLESPTLALKLPGNWSKFLNIGALASLRGIGPGRV